MLTRLKKTIRHTAIYLLGNLSTKLIGIVLLPLYTKELTVAEYGILGILEITIFIIAQILLTGQSHALLRFYDLDEFREKKKSVVLTIFIFLAVSGISINLFGYLYSSQLAYLFSESAKFEVYLKLCFVIILLRILNTFFFTVLRAKENSVLYAAGNIVKFLMILIFNVYFIAILKIGVKGILYSTMIGEAVILVFLFIYMIPEMVAKFEWKILSASISFGFPLVFTSIAVLSLSMGDRYILKILVNYKEVGLYNLGYKIAGVLNMLFIQSFTLGLMPLAYKMYGKQGDKRYYSKMLTYFLFVIMWAGLGLSVFSKEVLKIFVLSPDYMSAYNVVPIIVLLYVFSGAKSVVNLGLLLKRKTKYIAYKTIGAAVLNIILNFLLIPQFKMMGAAIATAISFFALYLVTYYLSNRFYKIPYENLKLVKMLATAIFLFLVSMLLHGAELWLSIFFKTILFISFPIMLYFMNFYEHIELQRIREIANKIKQGYYFKAL